MKQLFLAFIFLLLTDLVFAQPNVPVNGPADKAIRYDAFTDAVIYTASGTRLEHATMIIKDGIVLSVGVNLPVPREARVHNCTGKYIYPAFIDLYSDYGIQWKADKADRNNELLSSKPGAFAWNEAIRAEVNAAELFRYDDQRARQLKEAGFGIVLTGLQDGICRGSSALVFTAEGKENEMIIAGKAAAGFSLGKGSSGQPYPASLAGTIALLRQTYYDGKWYASQHDEYNISLEAFNKLRDLPAVFQVRDKLDILRVAKLAGEFGTKYIVKGAGDEYQRLKEIKAAGMPLIVPVKFPKPYQVEDPLDAEKISTADLKHWELAPANPYMLSSEEIDFAITYSGCESAAEFWKNLRKAVKSGLKESDALKALTETPARLIKIEKKAGRLQKGMSASFMISDGNIFDAKTSVMESWSNGKRYVITEPASVAITGEYRTDIPGYGLMSIKGDRKKQQASLIGADTLKGTVSSDAGIFYISFTGKEKNLRFVLWITETDTTGFPYYARNLKGQVTGDRGSPAYFTATLEKRNEADPVNKDSIPAPLLGKIIYPFVDFGWEVQPEQETVLFKNATVWTSGQDSVLNETAVLIEKGRIRSVGKNLPAGKARVIDATGKYLTSGIIDEHSHIALTRGVNEGTQAVTSEVRMGDAVSSEDINIYRQLAGGVVASQLLHGSANPIGGQSAMIKLRWGLVPEQMKLEGADGFIKFALGENVKQSNWGDRATFRYPQTRMGVEQVMTDAFTRARAYDKKTPAHRDLELEALAEVLNKKRFITCHSYVQSEINMLMHVADSFGFRVNTFTHILEGYKVADKMKKHGAGASTFADWWAYKYEVLEAIPYNAAILQKTGIVTAINSDDAEMGRRLNQEAAKIIKYGGITEAEAWRMVTINPAKLLHIDDRMGSIKVGKDADIVLWNDNPLSIYATPLYTFVDGRCYFDRQKDAAMHDEIRKERSRIISRMIAAKASGEQTEKKISKPQEVYKCETENEN